MTEVLGRAVLELKTDASGLKKGVDEAKEQTTGLRKHFASLKSELGTGLKQGLGIGVGLGVAGAVSGALQGAIGAMGDAVNAARDLAESQSKVDVVFGESADEIEAWAEDSATAIGQSKQAALEAVGTYGNLFQAFGIGRDEATKMSISLVELAADLASFNNTSVDDALLALRSGLSGETEPLKRFGIALNDARMRSELAAMGVENLTATLTPAQKAQAAYSLIMKDSALAQGDFARTADGAANKERILAAQLENQSAKIGEKLLPLWSKLLDLFIKLSPVLDLIGGAIGFVADALSLLIGVITAVTDAVGGFADDMAMNFGDMGDALHDVADQAGVDFQAVKDYVKDAMEESGLSFEEAVDKAKEHFGRLPEVAGTAGEVADSVKADWRGMKDSVVTDSAAMVDETKAHQRDLLESTRVTGDGIEDEYSTTYQHTLQDTREWAASMLRIFQEQEDPVRAAGEAAADAFVEPLTTGYKIAETEQELSDQRRILQSTESTAEEKRIAEQRTDELIAELIRLKNEQATQGDAMTQLARTQSLLTSQFMVDGLKNKDPEIRAAFIAWRTELELRLEQLKGAAYTGGANTTAAFARGVAETQWSMATAMRNAVGAARAMLPGSEPKDPTSPLRGVTRAFGLMDIMAGGIKRGGGSLTSALREALGHARGALSLGPLRGPSLALEGVAGLGQTITPTGMSLAGGDTHFHYELHVDGMRKTVSSPEEAIDELDRLGVFGG